MSKKRTINPGKSKHFFFLNPHEEHAFTRCPKCSEKTKVRKFPLVIHIEPHQIFMLNKRCKYCPVCDLIIAKQSEVEDAMVRMFEKIRPDIIGNDYMVIGTAERKDWVQVMSGKHDEMDMIDRIIVFEDVLDFEVIPGGWYRDGEHPGEKNSRQSDMVETPRASTSNESENLQSVTTGVKILTLRVECLYQEDECTRVIEIPDNYTLSHLHDAIQEAVGFGKDHLFEFYAGRHERDRKIVFSEAGEWEDTQLDYLGILLRNVWPLKGLSLYYLFDFGDCWLFRIRKERTVKELEKGIEYPRVIECIGENPEQYPSWD